MIKNWSFAKTTDILKTKMRSVIVSQNHYLNQILDVHPLTNWWFWIGDWYLRIRDWGFPEYLRHQFLVQNHQMVIWLPINISALISLNYESVNKSVDYWLRLFVEQSRIHRFCFKVKKRSTKRVWQWNIPRGLNSCRSQAQDRCPDWNSPAQTRFPAAAVSGSQSSQEEENGRNLGSRLGVVLVISTGTGWQRTGGGNTW